MESGNIKIYTKESVKRQNYNKNSRNACVRVKNAKCEVQNKIEYCLGNCFALLSAMFVIAVCQNSKVFLTQKYPLSITRALSKSMEWSFNQAWEAMLEPF